MSVVVESEWFRMGTSGAKRLVSWDLADTENASGWRERATIRNMKEKLARAKNPLKRQCYAKRLQAAQARLLALTLANS